MSGAWAEVRRYLKRGLAMVLFVLLLVGAGTTALMALAAGVSALGAAGAPRGEGFVTGTGTGSSGSSAAEPAGGLGSVSGTGGTDAWGTAAPAGVGSETQAPATPETGAGTAGSTAVAATGSAGSGLGTAGSPAQAHSWSDRMNDAIDHMHSPLGAAIDSGGYVIGNHIEQAFGSLLSGVLQTLFLERPDAAGGLGSDAAGGRTGEAGSGPAGAATTGAGGWR